MKKTLALILALLLIGSALPALAETVTVITINDPQKLFMEQIAQEYSESNPDGVTIEVVSTPFDSFDQKIQTMIASGTPLDTASHNGWTGFGAWRAMDYLQDMTPYMEKAGYDPLAVGLMEGAVKPWVIDGHTYALPVHAFGSYLLYNKSLFDEAGIAYPPSDFDDPDWTWDKMIDIAKQLTKNPDDMMNAQYGLWWDWASGGKEQEPQYFGLDTFPQNTWDNGGFATECYFDNPDVVAAYQKIADLTFVDKVSPPASFNEAVGGNAFFAGNCAMFVCGGWNLAGVNDLGFDVGVAAIPKGGNDAVRAVVWVDPYWIFKSSKVPEQTFNFIAYLTDPEVQQRIVEYSQGLAPANTKAFDKYFGFLNGVKPEEMKLALEGSFKYGFEGMSHLMPEAAALNTLISNEFDLLFKENRPASEVCASAQKVVTAHLQDVNAKYGK